MGTETLQGLHHELITREDRRAAFFSGLERRLPGWGHYLRAFLALAKLYDSGYYQRDGPNYQVEAHPNDNGIQLTCSVSESASRSRLLFREGRGTFSPPLTHPSQGGYLGTVDAFRLVCYPEVAG